MSLLAIAAFTVAIGAVIGLAFTLPDRWFCGLLSLACMLGSADATYHEVTPWAIALLTMGVAFAGAAVHGAVTTGRDRRQQR